MTSWTKDEDKYRLPEGMVRIGYDADKQRYQFHDRKDGSLWEGPEGSQYGKLRRVSTSAPGGPDAKMFSDCNSAPAVQSIPRKPVRSSTTRPTSPAAKDFDQILGGMHRERSSSEAGLNANGAATAGAAMLDSAIKRSASVVRLIFDA